MKEKTRKVVTGVCALALTAAVSIAGTLAYLSKVTEQRANNFTFATEALNAMLTEPYWDGVVDYYYEDDDTIHAIYDYVDGDKNDEDTTQDDPVYGYVDGDKEQPILYTPDELAATKKDAGNWPDDLPDGWDDVLDELWDSSSGKWKDKYPEDYADEDKQGKTFDPWDLYEQPTEYPEGSDIDSDYDGLYNNDPKKKQTQDDPGRLVAQHMLPGEVANKNPFITNTGEIDEWLAAKVSFVYGEGSEKAGQVLSDADYKKLIEVIRVDWNTNAVLTSEIDRTNTNGADNTPKGWYVLDGFYDGKTVDADGKVSGNSADTVKGTDGQTDYYVNAADYLFENQQTVFYYTAIVDAYNSTAKTFKDKYANSVTKPIFTKVTVDPEATPEQIKALEDMGGFAIYIEGYAIQSNAFEFSKDWIDSGKASFQSDGVENPKNESIGDVDQPGISPAPVVGSQSSIKD